MTSEPPDVIEAVPGLLKLAVPMVTPLARFTEPPVTAKLVMEPALLMYTWPPETPALASVACDPTVTLAAPETVAVLTVVRPPKVVVPPLSVAVPIVSTSEVVERHLAAADGQRRARTRHDGTVVVDVQHALTADAHGRRRLSGCRR